MKDIVLCKHCGEPEYFEEMRWLNGFYGCRNCYKTEFKYENQKSYHSNEVDGKRPTMEEYIEQQKKVAAFLSKKVMPVAKIVANTNCKISSIYRCAVENAISHDSKTEINNDAEDSVDKITIGDRVICFPDNVSGIVIKQYYPTACEHQTMILCDDGRKYRAPTRMYMKIENEQD